MISPSDLTLILLCSSFVIALAPLFDRIVGAKVKEGGR